MKSTIGHRQGAPTPSPGSVVHPDATAARSCPRPAESHWNPEEPTYSGLSQPYSYSDMTGWGLKNVLPQ